MLIISCQRTFKDILYLYLIKYMDLGSKFESILELESCTWNYSVS